MGSTLKFNVWTCVWDRLKCPVTRGKWKESLEHVHLNGEGVGGSFKMTLSMDNECVHVSAGVGAVARPLHASTCLQG